MSIRATTALLLLALAPLAMASKSNIAAKETFNIDSVHSTAIFEMKKRWRSLSASSLLIRCGKPWLFSISMGRRILTMTS